MYEGFTDRARRVLHILAAQEASRFCHENINPEHILLAIIKEGSGTAVKLFNSFDIEPQRIRLEIEKALTPGEKIATGILPQTHRTKRVVELAINHSRALKQSKVGTEHLLIGILAERESAAAVILRMLGLTVQSVTAHISTASSMDDLCNLVGGPPERALRTAVRIISELKALTATLPNTATP